MPINPLHYRRKDKDRMIQEEERTMSKRQEESTVLSTTPPKFVSNVLTTFNSGKSASHQNAMIGFMADKAVQ